MFAPPGGLSWDAPLSDNLLSTRLLSANEVQERLGHESLAPTGVYLKADSRTVDAKAQSLW